MVKWKKKITLFFVTFKRIQICYVYSMFIQCSDIYSISETYLDFIINISNIALNFQQSWIKISDNYEYLFLSIYSGIIF